MEPRFPTAASFAGAPGRIIAAEVLFLGPLKFGSRATLADTARQRPVARPAKNPMPASRRSGPSFAPLLLLVVRPLRAAHRGPWCLAAPRKAGSLAVSGISSRTQALAVHHPVPEHLQAWPPGGEILRAKAPDLERQGKHSKLSIWRTERCELAACAAFEAARPPGPACGPGRRPGGLAPVRRLCTRLASCQTWHATARTRC